MAASNHQVIRIQRDLTALEKIPLDFIQHLASKVNDEGLQQVTGVMIGPEKSPYVDGYFRFTMTFPSEYPFKAPNFVFTTPICHPNIRSSTGAISIDILFQAWTPTMTIDQVLNSIHLLLANPNYDTPIEAATVLDKSPKKAREWTQQFAQNSLLRQE